MELYNSEYVMLKSMGYGIYLVSFMSPANPRKISGIELRSKILDTVGMRIKEIVTDLNVDNLAVIMTIDGMPTCKLERDSISSEELTYLDEAAQISSQEFLDRTRLIKEAFGSI